MSFPRYERYKDSGVEWLGEVPEHWVVTKLKRVATKIGSGKTPRGGSEVYVSEGVIFLRSQNVHDAGLRLDDVVYISPEIDEEMDNTRVQTGDILLNVTGASIGRTSMVPISLGAANVSQHVCIIRIPNIDSRNFLAAALQGHVIKSQIALAQNGAAREGLNFEQIGNLVFALPPSAEEFQAISSFLHRELKQIDSLIEEQRRLIELLKEKRQAVISHAVARIPSPQSEGPDAPTAISRNRLRHHVVRIDQGWSPVAADRDPEPGEWAVLKLSAVKRGEFDETKIKALPPEAEILDRLQLKDGDFLITRANTPDLVGDSCYVSNPPPRLIFSDLIYRVVLTEDTMSGEFLNLVLQSAIGRGQARRDARGSSQSMVKLSHEHILNWLVPAPPIDEQKEIVKAVNEQLEELNRVEEVCKQSISLLEERRSALISAAVTGKIDVRAYMAKPVMSATQYSSGFAHQLLAAEILDRCNSQRMGRIKLQKLIHLCEYHGQVSEVQGDYSRKAAGPFDAKAMAGISKNLRKQKWFEEVREGERYVYRPLEKHGEHKKYLAHWQAQMPRINEVLNLLGTFKTRECEIVSTLYAAWNDLLIDGGSTDDAAILHEASSAERWHKSKEQIAPERWRKALQWMKDKGLAPVGYGKHTRHTAGQIGTTTEVAHEPA